MTRTVTGSGIMDPKVSIRVREFVGVVVRELQATTSIGKARRLLIR